MKEWKKEFKMETDTIKKTLKEITLEVEHLKKKSGVTEASISNRLQEMEERISEAEDHIVNIDKTAREDAENKKLLTQNVQEIQDTMRRQNLRIIGIEEGEEYQLRGTLNIFNKSIEENFPTLKNEMTTGIKKSLRNSK